jgi:hypothetical protein
MVIKKGTPRAEAAGLQPPKPPKPKLKKKNTDFVDIMTSKISHDFPLSRTQALKSADDWYIRILKNKLIKLKNNKIGHCDIVIFVCI